MSVLCFLPFLHVCVTIWKVCNINRATLAWIIGIHAFTAVFCSMAWLVDSFPGFGKEEGEGKARASKQERLTDVHCLLIQLVRALLKSLGDTFPSLAGPRYNLFYFLIVNRASIIWTFSVVRGSHCSFSGLGFFPFIKWGGGGLISGWGVWELGAQGKNMGISV